MICLIHLEFKIPNKTIQNQVQDFGVSKTMSSLSSQASSMFPPHASTVRDMESNSFPLTHSNIPAGMFNDGAGGKSPVTQTTRERSVDDNTSGIAVELYVKPGIVENKNSSSTHFVVPPSSGNGDKRSFTSQQPSDALKQELPVPPKSLEETAVKGNHMLPSGTDHPQSGIQAGGSSSTSLPSILGYTQQSTQQHGLTVYTSNEMKKLLEEKNELMEEKDKRIRELESEREDKIKQDEEKIRKHKEYLEEREKRQDTEFEERKKKLEKEFDERKTKSEEECEKRKKNLDECEKKLEKDNEQLRNARKGINRDSEKQRKQMERGISVEKQRMRREISDEKKTMEQDIETRRRSLTDDAESFLLVKRKELDSWEARLNDKEINFDREKKRVLQKEKEANERKQKLDEQLEDFEKDKKLQEKQKQAIKNKEKRVNASNQKVKDKWEGYWAEDAILRQRNKEIERVEAKQKEKKINQLLDIKTYNIMLSVIVFLILLWICTIAIVYYKFYNFL